jgi:hypothetical protein
LVLSSYRKFGLRGLPPFLLPPRPILI